MNFADLKPPLSVPTPDEVAARKHVLVIGAAGSIGTHLLQTLTHTQYVPIAALHRSPLSEELAKNVICEFGFNIRDESSIERIFDKYASTIDSVWNLAAPLSVDTAQDPTSAYDITVGGMTRVLACMKKYGVKKLYFSDSIGSYGVSAPRDDASALWLMENATQDPGSDYGVQKRQCRELLHEYADKYQFDTRFIIIPGVLHTQPSWGGGTTEYALDALAAAVNGVSYTCPVPSDVFLPMIHVKDLINGMVKLMEAPIEHILPVCRGVAMAGFSFTPDMLFQEIKKHYPSFSYSYDDTSNPSVTLFAKIWPNTLSPVEAQVRLGFTSKKFLQETVSDILEAHALRQSSRVSAESSKL